MWRYWWRDCGVTVDGLWRYWWSLYAVFVYEKFVPLPYTSHTSEPMQDITADEQAQELHAVIKLNTSTTASHYILYSCKKTSQVILQIFGYHITLRTM